MKQLVRCPAGNLYDASAHADCPCPICWADRASSTLGHAAQVPKKQPTPENVVPPQAAPSQPVLEFDDAVPGGEAGMTDFLEQPPDMTLRRLLFSFEGSIGIGKFWLGIVISMSSFVASVVGAGLILLIVERLFGYAAIPASIPNVISLGVLFGIGPVFYINLAVAVKRCHDLNASPWILLATFIPYVGALGLLIYLGAFSGQLADTSTNERESAAPH